MTLYGFALATSAANWDWFARWRYASLGIGLALYALAMLLFGTGIVHRDTALDAFIANAFTWCWLMVFLGYGRRYLSFSNALLRWARDASYPVYILHQTVIIMIGFYVIQQPWTPWTKYAVVLGGTMLSCFFTVRTDRAALRNHASDFRDEVFGDDNEVGRNRDADGHSVRARRT